MKFSTVIIDDIIYTLNKEFQCLQTFDFVKKYVIPDTYLKKCYMRDLLIGNTENNSEVSIVTYFKGRGYVTEFQQRHAVVGLLLPDIVRVTNENFKVWLMFHLLN